MGPQEPIHQPWYVAQRYNYNNSQRNTINTSILTRRSHPVQRPWKRRVEPHLDVGAWRSDIEMCRCRVHAFFFSLQFWERRPNLPRGGVSLYCGMFNKSFCWSFSGVDAVAIITGFSFCMVRLLHLLKSSLSFIIFCVYSHLGIIAAVWM